MSRDTQMAKWRMRQDTDRQGTAKDMLDGEAIDDGMNLDDADAFLLALEVTNLSPVQAFEAVLTSSDSIGATVEERIEPNTTVTMLIPIAKIRLSEEQKLQPLPVLSNRQFVIGKNVLPPLELERFWLRDELLRTVCLSWREGQSRKTGACNLRHLSLSNEMLSAIQLSDISLKVEVRQDGELCSRDSDSRWEVEEGSFTELSFRLQNLKCTADFAAPSLDCSVPTDLDASAARPVRTSARLEPRLALQQGTDSNAILRNVILDGNPIILLSSLDPGQESESAVDFSLCFMSKGTFIVDIILEEEDQDMTTGSIAVDSARIRHSVHFNVS